MSKGGVKIMQEIIVPFYCKSKARNAGAYFDRESRKWFIPDDIPDENRLILQNLQYETEEIIEDEVPYILQEEEIEVPIILQSPSNTLIDWPNIIEKQDTLQIASYIRDYGMPESEEDRTRLLTILSLRRPKEYPISYDHLLNCSEGFAALYPQSRCMELIKSCITGTKPYTEEINHSNLSKEEKALLFFLLPM